MGAHDPLDAHARTSAPEAEQSILGALLLDNGALEEIAGIVSEADFTIGEHALVFKAIRELIQRGARADAVTVFERLHSVDAKVDQPLAFLTDLVHATPSAAGVRHYAEIVRNRSISRRMLRVSERLRNAVLKPGGKSPLELLDLAQGELLKIADTSSAADDEFRPISAALTSVIQRIDDRYHAGGAAQIGGTATGFVDLDRHTDGMHGGELIVVAGRPSMGKTSYAMNIAEHVAVELRMPVAVLSLEMPDDQLATRMLAGTSRINQHKLRTASLRDDDWSRLTHGTQILVDAPVYVLDSSSVTPLQFKAKLRRLQRVVGKLGLIIVDYLQLMSGDGGSGENRTSEVSQISRELKKTAKEFDAPVIALSQLNRGLEQRPNKRPMMSDLRESGAIEQDADVIQFIYRDEVYNPDSADRGTAELIIAKQRNGPLATVRLAFRNELARFENFAEPTGAY
ncbi:MULTISPECIES: replicative DNA helicase [Burkholderia cepacia complex]|uniref:replicative DNA helicase n=1 Tax=Burkholderia cepacia complex TaxID=87882 RepID=UPI00264C2C22|nr:MULTISPECIES: replicative DNA helicase [Burkholderia cepacia complex]MDN7584185.1 replicative DNA helicase [Burkholderia orbicola]MDN7728708.1 replicative DNA helicase [Burkholderia orbicola]MDR8069405.1 replicative DNA helicase [Burkholderia cenocepacia]MDV3101745.1 replicative DNA helicase [Burkholderia cenocepacia]